MTDKSDDRVGHLNTILARGGGNLNDRGGGGMLKFRVDRRITRRQNKMCLVAAEPCMGPRLQLSMF